MNLISGIDITASALSAQKTRLDIIAQNIANAQTEGYSRRAVQQSPQAQGGVSTQVVAAAQPGPALEADVVSQLQAKNAFLANLAVFKTSNDLAGALLDQKA